MPDNTKIQQNSILKASNNIRVFDKYVYNIADKVKFKDTIKYLENMMQDCDLQYQDISFHFDGYEALDKVLEKYPELSKYYFDFFRTERKILTSITPKWADGKIYAEPEDWSAIFSIIAKVPRGYHLFPAITFDKIDWYGEGVREAALNVNSTTKGHAMMCGTHTAINSQITLEREYDYGNKYNMVSVVVEATTEDEPRDTSDIIKKLEPYLGQPAIIQNGICRFSIEENTLLKEHERTCSKTLQRMIEDVYPEEERSDSAIYVDKLTYICDVYPEEKTSNSTVYVSFIPNLANKKKIDKAFKETDFVLGDRDGLLPGMNHVICVDKHNYQFEITFNRTQSSPNYFYFYIDVKGYNFYIKSEQNTIYASSEEEAMEKLYGLADFCMKLKDEFGAILEKNFGCTPEWYMRKKSNDYYRL